MARLDTCPSLEERICSNCDKSWKESRHVQGNPLSVFAVQLKGKQLMVSRDAQFPILALLIGKPSFLMQVFAGQADPADKQMARLCARGHSADATFVFCQAGGFSLLYHMVQNGSLQLVILGCRGLCKLLTNKLYCSAISAHLRARKTIWALHQFFGWPCLAQHVTSFVHSCDTCQHFKGRTTALSGLLASLSIPAFKFE